MLLIEACTKLGRRHMSGISEDTTELLTFFKKWIDKYDLAPENIWFAEIYNIDSLARIGELTLQPDGSVIIDIWNEDRPLSFWQDMWRKVLVR